MKDYRRLGRFGSTTSVRHTISAANRKYEALDTLGLAVREVRDLIELADTLQRFIFEGES